MKPQTIRHLIIALLMLNAIFHLAAALLGGAPGFGWGLTLFGFAYLFLSFYVRRDVHEGGKKKKGHVNGRTAMILTAVVTLSGLAIGGSHYLTVSASSALFMMGLIDVAILGAVAFWFIKAGAFKQPSP